MKENRKRRALVLTVAAFAMAFVLTACTQTADSDIGDGGSSSNLENPAPTPSPTPASTTYTVKITNQGSTYSTATASPTSASEGETVTLTAKATEGYKFDKWTVTGGGVTIVNPSEANATFTMGSQNVEITAEFSLNVTQVTVKFNAEGGTVTPAQKTLKKGEAVGELPTPTRSGYSFVGWYDKENGQGTKWESTTKVDADTTLYAYWNNSQNP